MEFILLDVSSGRGITIRTEAANIPGGVFIRTTMLTQEPGVPHHAKATNIAIDTETIMGIEVAEDEDGTNQLFKIGK